MCDMAQCDGTLRDKNLNEKTWNVVREDTGAIVEQYSSQELAMFHVLRDIINLRSEVS